MPRKPIKAEARDDVGPYDFYHSSTHRMHPACHPFKLLALVPRDQGWCAARIRASKQAIKDSSGLLVAHVSRLLASDLRRTVTHHHPSPSSAYCLG